MEALIGILIVLVCVVLGFLVLIQNPKGGGLSGSFGGLGTQMMGVKQSTETVEKGTWIMGGALALLCVLFLAFGSPKQSSNTKNALDKALDATKSGSAPAAPQPALPSGPAPVNAAPSTNAPAMPATK